MDSKIIAKLDLRRSLANYAAVFDPANRRAVIINSGRSAELSEWILVLYPPNGECIHFSGFLPRTDTPLTKEALPLIPSEWPETLSAFIFDIPRKNAATSFAMQQDSTLLVTSDVENVSGVFYGRTIPQNQADDETVICAVLLADSEENHSFAFITMDKKMKNFARSTAISIARRGRGGDE